MGAIVVLGLALCAGFLFRRRGLAPVGSAKAATLFVVWLALPAVILDKVHALAAQGLRASALVPASMAYLVFGLTAIAIGLVGKLRRWDRATKLSLLLTVGFCNTSFVGYPLTEALFGPEALPTAVLTDQPGSFLLLAVMAPIIVAMGVKGASRGRWASGIVGRIARFPPSWALLVALMLGRVPFPLLVADALARLGAPLGPIALFAVGLELGEHRLAFRRRGFELAFGLGWKLGLAPFFALVVYRSWLVTPTKEANVIVAQAATAPMVTSALLAIEAGLAPDLAATLLALGIPLSLVTVPVWVSLLRR